MVLQNLLPYGATVALQTTMSNLLHAYKRNELDPATGLGLFALSATLTDRAEPSESLQATVAWQVGLEDAHTLLCTDQLDGFRYGRSLAPEQDICGKAGAYLVNSSFVLTPGEQKQWYIVADVNQDSTAVTRLVRFLNQDRSYHRRANRGGHKPGNGRSGPLCGYGRWFAAFVRRKQRRPIISLTSSSTSCAAVYLPMAIEWSEMIYWTSCKCVIAPFSKRLPAWFAKLPEQMFIRELYARAADSGIPDLIRLCYEYLPLSFSRRHGDPSRPWNHFSINLKKPDGSPQLDYQGNWRDIFQNWEPLLLSFPAYIEGVISKFLNATTADGYNPYRVTRAGVEWEVPEPNNPWANIGYWSDHQIIYLQKLLEIAEQVHPWFIARPLEPSHLFLCQRTLSSSFIPGNAG